MTATFHVGDAIEVLTIEKIEGEWPEWAKDAIHQESLSWFDDNWHGLADETGDLLDALLHALTLRGGYQK